MPSAAWEEMLRQRGFNPQLSRLAVEDGAVEAYWLVGTEAQARPGESYGISVGTRPRARRRGLSRQLWERVAARLRQRGIANHVLEVIETNTRAVPLYEGLGFAKARRVECFKGPAPNEAPGMTGLTFKDVAVDKTETLGAPWRDWQPTWQNDTPAVGNLGGAMTATLAYNGEAPVAFGYFHQTYGLISQIAVAPVHRRQGIGKALLAHWARAHDKETMVILNIPDTEDATLGFFLALGWENHVNQFEMRITL
jgi:ribosomal protein S18 acetylase RimI-like enzyme